MAEDIVAVKRRLSAAYLGRGGIHGIGVRRKQSAIWVGIRSARGPEAEALLARIRAEAAPFDVLVKEEAPPTIGC